MTLKDRRTKSREINSELTCYLFVGFDILGQTTFEGVDWAPGHESEKFVFGFFVVVSLSGESASDPLWDVGGSLGPDLLVQVSIYTEQFSISSYPAPLSYKLSILDSLLCTFHCFKLFTIFKLCYFVHFAPSFPGSIKNPLQLLNSVNFVELWEICIIT